MTAPRAREQAGPPSPVRSGRALAAVALLALSGALALPATAEAQTTITFVSNINQTAATAVGSSFISQAFTAGSHASGYVLTGVDIVAASTTAFTAKVCGTDTSGKPTSTCTDLTAPGSIAIGANSFTAPTNTTLMSATTYAVVLTGEFYEGLSYGTTESNGEDTGYATGWSIADSTFHSISFSQERDYEIRIAIKGSNAANAAPVYDPTTETREVPENSAAGTDVGDPIPEATDAEDDTLTYSMGGTDAASFAFDASTRQITTIANVDYNHEATQNSYSVTVTATDAGGSGGSADVTVTIDVTDVNEQPAIAGRADGDGDGGRRRQPGRELGEAGPERRPGDHRLQPAVRSSARHRLER